MPQTILTDVERRAVANLSIPRSVQDLAQELRKDQYLISPWADGLVPEGNLHGLLDQLAAAGLVVNLGDGRDMTPGHLAAHVDSHPEARSMPDEKARLFEARLSEAHRSWRLHGDVWMLTDAGFDKLHEPVMESAPYDQAAIERLLAAHGRAVVDAGLEGSIHDANGGLLPQAPDDQPSLAGAMGPDGPIATLLPEEYKDWSAQVIAEAEERLGARITPPLAGGMPGYSDAWENNGIDAENGKATGFQITAPWYMALTTVAVTDADTGSTITEAGYTGYARKSVAAADMNASSAGSAANANAIVFAGCTAGTSTVIGFAKCIAATVGVMQKYGTLASTVISTTQTPAQFGAGAFTTSLD